MSLSFKGAWWEVDLGSGIPVDKVIVLGYLECCQERLAPVTLSLRDQYNTTLWQYKITDSTTLKVISFEIVNGKILTFPMNQDTHQTKNTPRRNFCVKDCTASWERNDVNVRFFFLYFGLHYNNSTSYKHRFRTN